MKALLHLLLTLACILLSSGYVSARPHHEIHVNVGAATDLIDSIFQIPIMTLNAVGNLLKNVHSAKRNLISVNLNVDHPGYDGHKPSHPTKKPYYPTKPTGYPEHKPVTPDCTPESSSSRPVTGTVTEGLNSESPTETTSGEIGGDTTVGAPPTPDLANNQRVPPAPAVQPPYQVQPLSLDVGGGVNPNKQTTKEKNFTEYVKKKLAEKNLQDNRISYTN